MLFRTGQDPYLEATFQDNILLPISHQLRIMWCFDKHLEYKLHQMAVFPPHDDLVLASEKEIHWFF